jgi:hypothetical protein
MDTAEYYFLEDRCDQKPNLVSKEILVEFSYAFDKYAENITKISPNLKSNLEVPSTVRNFRPGQVREYKVVGFSFKNLPFDYLDIGVVKNVSGKGTYYLTIVISTEMGEEMQGNLSIEITGNQTLEDGFEKLAKFVENWVHEHRGVKTGKSTGILDNDASWKKIASKRRGTLNFLDFLNSQESGE